MVPQFLVESGPFAADPYEILAKLREDHPVYWHDELNAYVLTRYEDIKRASEDDTNFHSSGGGNPSEPYVVQLDGPDHRRLRRLLTSTFSPRSLSQSIEPRLPEIANGLIDRFAERGWADLVAEFGDAMAASVIGALLNIPAVSESWLVHAADDMLEAEANPANAALQARYEQVVSQLNSFIQESIERERRSPSGCLISDMVAAEEEGDRLTTDELLANAKLLVIAGIETSRRLIASTVYAMVKHGDQFVAPMDDLAQIKLAIEETLRFYPPNQVVIRFVRQPVELHGVRLEPGTKIYGMRGSANRDSSVWENPDEFVLQRFSQRKLPTNMAFGWGPHHCIGAYLARLETSYAVSALFRRLEAFDLDPAHPVAFSGFRNRGPAHLFLTFKQKESVKTTEPA